MKKVPPTPPQKLYPTASLDSPNFDDVAFINQLLPEPNTKNFNKKFKEITEMYEATEKELSQQVFNFFEKSVSVNDTIAESAEQLKALLLQTHETTNRSVMSEQEVLKVCDGMRRMGYAKGNLEAIIQIITHLDQLFNCLDKLDHLLDKKKYDDIIKILQTTHLLLNLFEKFSSSEPTISTALQRYDVFSERVLDEAKKVIDQFEKKTLSKDDLKQFITIVDSLSQKHIDEFVTWMYNHLLVGYSNEFPLTGEMSGLDNIDKRYIWFNKKYLSYEDMYSTIFPSRWKVGEALVLEFVSSTKVAFSMLLDKLIDDAHSQNGIDETTFTTRIVKALHITIIFEQQLYKRLYHKEYQRPIKPPMELSKASNSSLKLVPKKTPPQPYQKALPKPSASAQSTPKTSAPKRLVKNMSSAMSTPHTETNPFDDSSDDEPKGITTDSIKSSQSKNPFSESDSTGSDGGEETNNPFSSTNSNISTAKVDGVTKHNTIITHKHENKKVNDSNPFDDDSDSDNTKENKEITQPNLNPFDDGTDSSEHETKTPQVKMSSNTDGEGSSRHISPKIETNHFETMEPTDAYVDVSNPFEHRNETKESEQTAFTVGVLSRCFEPYMSGYVDLENTNLTSFVNKVLNEENFQEDPEDGVLPSCKDYIFYCKKCGERCIQITQGKPLIDICNQIAEHAEQYSRGILSKCKENETIKRSCISINTCDYLGGRLEQLLTGYTEMATVSGAYQLQTFQFSIINQCVKPIIQYLVLCLIEKAKGAITEITKMNWDISCESIDDEDDYVFQMVSLINQQFSIVKSKIFQNYYLRICHATVSLIIDELFDTIFKCKKISIEGAQKMQMGFSQIKSSLQKLPVLEAPSFSEVGKGQEVYSETDYALHVKKSFSRIENTLKILQCDNKETAYTLYQQLNPLQSDELFKKIWKKTESVKDTQKLLSEMKKLKKIGK
ncbi:hypothetical protein EHI8A_024650 [Entamoeba histolytica HM-1:IMSS-B]|uniref:Vps53 N-terminal domain-containing protein n=5 Tax=Entamoeba histolytica TaxID=5759 RepID=C4M183_ENTH1|nr:hypothetical protein, conserved [Entamoeba histolytica HM-1:IMSS]EMH74480.1 hypothetical protein EHI8A_024650 [Entamoeba histolytica HM-1:IMSS-B]EMS15603.1 hypothetical protein KM1_045460 [Entamoeba histolytica HM-3:IMSS]ENY63515.1 hypothetical protein EHI7A_019520 [Entamoeba histolytica HM-1:IMSS-A]GAT94958.1 hypothetical protein conserved [Entamoeba histolytica]EAL48287.1 hypothetical protein, conserved [Entamoeba histolytica HM-1:IMSS]|eukprot:XP_653675.1 hypothetical protein, conserved [Entamoeba histolytica HM-1:IMSS]